MKTTYKDENGQKHFFWNDDFLKAFDIHHITNEFYDREIGLTSADANTTNPEKGWFIVFVKNRYLKHNLTDTEGKEIDYIHNEQMSIALWTLKNKIYGYANVGFVDINDGGEELSLTFDVKKTPSAFFVKNGKIHWMPRFEDR